MKTFLRNLFLTATLWSVVFMADAQRASMRVDFSFAADVDLQKKWTDASLSAHYGERWTQRKAAFGDAFVARLQHLMPDYQLSRGSADAQYFLRVTVTDLDLDGELDADVALANVIAPGDSLWLIDDDFDVDGGREVDEYVQLADAPFVALADEVFYNQISGLVRRQKMLSAGRYDSQRGFEPEVRATHEVYRSVYLTRGVGTSMVVGYRINDWVSAGPGIGLSLHRFDHDDFESNWEVPLFVQGRCGVPFWRVSPYAIAQVGYTFGRVKYDGWYEPWFKTRFSPGMFWMAGAGLSIKLHRGMIFADVSFRRQLWDCSLSNPKLISSTVGYRIFLPR